MKRKEFLYIGLVIPFTVAILLAYWIIGVFAGTNPSKIIKRILDLHEIPFIIIATVILIVLKSERMLTLKMVICTLTQVFVVYYLLLAFQ
jgi:hypothetical protein